MHKLHAIFAHLRPNCGGSLTAGVAALLTTFKDFSSLDEQSDFKLTKKISKSKKNKLKLSPWSRTGRRQRKRSINSFDVEQGWEFCVKVVTHTTHSPQVSHSRKSRLKFGQCNRKRNH